MALRQRVVPVVAAKASHRGQHWARQQTQKAVLQRLQDLRLPNIRLRSQRRWADPIQLGPLGAWFRGLTSEYVNSVNLDYVMYLISTFRLYIEKWCLTWLKHIVNIDEMIIQLVFATYLETRGLFLETVNFFNFFFLNFRVNKKGLCSEFGPTSPSKRLLGFSLKEPSWKIYILLSILSYLLHLFYPRATAAACDIHHNKTLYSPKTMSLSYFFNQNGNMVCCNYACELFTELYRFRNKSKELTRIFILNITDV